jgi:hypothetical protein
MEKPQRTQEEAGSVGESRPYRLRVPWLDENAEIGLGDVIKRATSYVGLKHCRGCERRAAALNRWIAFLGRSERR